LYLHVLAIIITAVHRETILFLSVFQNFDDMLRPKVAQYSQFNMYKEEKNRIGVYVPVKHTLYEKL